MNHLQRLGKNKWWAVVAGVLLLALILGALSVYVRFARAPASLSDIAQVTTSIQYCNDKDPSRTLDLYRPKSVGSEKLPFIVYIHGGGWRWGDETNQLLKTYAPRFIQKGIAVATLDYRLNPANPYPDQNNDIACALAYLDANADALQLDTQKIIYFGDSAGGELVAFAALNIPFGQYDYEAPVGVIDFYGVSDFSKIVDGARPDFNARRYLGSNYNKVANEASPTSYVTKQAPRFLFFHGTNDTVVPIEQSRSLYALLTKAGVDAEFITVQGAGHAFSGPELSPTENKKIVDNINLFIRETINR